MEAARTRFGELFRRYFGDFAVEGNRQSRTIPNPAKKTGQNETKSGLLENRLVDNQAVIEIRFEALYRFSGRRKGLNRLPSRF